MRILHLVTTGDRRGAEIFGSELIASMKKDGVQQRVVVLRGSGSMTVRFDAPVASLGVNSLGVPFARVVPRAVRALRSHLQDWRPDIMLAHGGSTLKYAVLANTGRRTQIVFRSIGVAPPWIRRGPRRIAHSYLMRRSARVVAVADAVRQELIDVFGLPATRVVTIPNGVDPDRLEPTETREVTRRKLGIPATHRVLISIGALTWEKDPLAHLELSSRIMKCRSAVTHLVVGDGPMRRELDQTIGRWGLGRWVRVLGSRSDVADLLCASDIVLLASRIEGMPATIIEAGMVGLPVAGYAVAGVPEVIVDGRTGLLTSPGDLDGLIDRALRLIDNEAVRRELGAAARQRCRCRYDISTIANQYLSLYEDVVADE